MKKEKKSGAGLVSFYRRAERSKAMSFLASRSTGTVRCGGWVHHSVAQKLYTEGEGNQGPETLANHNTSGGGEGKDSLGQAGVLGDASGEGWGGTA